MGNRRPRPARLAEKLLHIRAALGLSQSEMLRALGTAAEKKDRHYISLFETGQREPSLLILFEYAKAAGVCLDVLVDDTQDLPSELPGRPAHEGVKRAPASRSGKRRSK
jgi:transcriptional regulator with XRE-family HTH domain